MKLLLLIIISILTGCGTFQIKNGIYTNNMDFDYHVYSYLENKEKYLGTRNANYYIRVYFFYLDGAIADCRTEKIKYPDGTVRVKKQIRIDPGKWRFLYFYQKRIVILHELGHCDLDLDHGEQGTVMGPKLMPYYHFINAEEFYLEQLFLGDNNGIRFNKKENHSCKM